MKRTLLFIIFIVATTINTLAQAVDNDQVEMAEQMRADGKIYVVVAVVLVVFIGLILYLISIDRKISRLEKEKASL